jgi:hypothetical protein
MPDNENECLSMWDDEWELDELVSPTLFGPCLNDTQNRLCDNDTNERMCYLSFIGQDLDKMNHAQSLSFSKDADSEFDSESDSNDSSPPQSVRLRGGRKVKQYKNSGGPVAGWNTYICLDDYLNKLARYSKPNETNDQWELFEKSQLTQLHDSEPTLSLHEYYDWNYNNSDEWGGVMDYSLSHFDHYFNSDGNHDGDSEVKLYDVKRAKKSSSNATDSLRLKE